MAYAGFQKDEEELKVSDKTKYHSLYLLLIKIFIDIMDSKAEGLRQSMLEKQRQKIYEESEKERQKNAKVSPALHCTLIANLTHRKGR